MTRIVFDLEIRLDLSSLWYALFRRVASCCETALGCFLEACSLSKRQSVAPASPAKPPMHTINARLATLTRPLVLRHLFTTP